MTRLASQLEKTGTLGLDLGDLSRENQDRRV
jgi:hypothetical protein